MPVLSIVTAVCSSAATARMFGEVRFGHQIGARKLQRAQKSQPGGWLD
jgi:hypothetical protein